jgi:hypothetical protein
MGHNLHRLRKCLFGRNNNKQWRRKRSANGCGWKEVRSDKDFDWVCKTKYKIKDPKIIDTINYCRPYDCRMYCDKLSDEINVNLDELANTKNKWVQSSFDRTHSIHKKRQTRERKWSRKYKQEEQEQNYIIINNNHRALCCHYGIVEFCDEHWIERGKCLQCWWNEMCPGIMP